MQSRYRWTQDAALTADALEIAARVRGGEWLASDVVDAHIDRIRACNGPINALVADRFDAAREEARALDDAAAAERARLPLAGVPFTVKEMIEVAGMPLTFGSRGRAGRRAQQDATAIARLRTAGAIPLGVSNVPEWGMWVETYNDVYGRTSNPHDVRRTAGGSSGGEGALVAVRGSAFGIGSDIGGSVRMPAAFCGVYGHKPTNGLVPLTGHYPVYASGPDAGLDRRAPYVTIGVLARSAGDLMPVLRVMSGPDAADPNGESLALGEPESVAWAGRRAVVLAAPRVRLARGARADLQADVRRAGEVLAAHGAAVVEAPADLFAPALELWTSALQSSSGVRFGEALGGGVRVQSLRESAAALWGRGRYSWPALFFCLLDEFGRRSDRRVRRALAKLERLGARFTDLTGDDGVLILPAHPSSAPRHNEPVLHPFDFLYTAVMNALRVPATVAPTGLGADGLPRAVQFAAPRGHDDVTIGAALLCGRPALTAAAVNGGSARPI